MKKQILISMILFTASLSHAKTYLCLGLDNSDFVETNLEENDVKEIGTLNGSPVKISDNKNRVSLSIKNKDNVVVLVALSGALTYHVNDGKSVTDLTCIIKQ